MYVRGINFVSVSTIFKNHILELYFLFSFCTAKIYRKKLLKFYNF